MKSNSVTRVEQSRLHRAAEALVEEVAHRERIPLSAALDRVAKELEARVARPS